VDEYLGDALNDTVLRSKEDWEKRLSTTCAPFLGIGNLKLSVVYENGSSGSMEKFSMKLDPDACGDYLLYSDKGIAGFEIPLQEDVVLKGRFMRLNGNIKVKTMKLTTSSEKHPVFFDRFTTNATTDMYDWYERDPEEAWGVKKTV